MKDLEMGVENQTHIFISSILFGLALGCLYDVFRIFRFFISASFFQVFLLDVFYFFCCGILTFLFILSTNYGEIRFYMIAGEIIGWCIYHLTLGMLVFKGLTWMFYFLHRLWNKWKTIFYTPFLYLKRIFSPYFLKFTQNRTKFLEKISNRPKKP